MTVAARVPQPWNRDEVTEASEVTDRGAAGARSVLPGQVRFTGQPELAGLAETASGRDPARSSLLHDLQDTL